MSLHTSRSHYHSSTGDSKKKKQHSLITVSQHHVDLCSFGAASAALLRTCAVRSGGLGEGDCRHQSDD